MGEGGISRSKEEYEVHEDKVQGQGRMRIKDNKGQRSWMKTTTDKKEDNDKDARHQQQRTTREDEDEDEE